ncbi:MAG: ATP-binding cassette domain-containing protein [Clostridiales bacterium]|nr:ATP-binding cassette domain-containing protein [Clostridiales bacterium]
MNTLILAVCCVLGTAGTYFTCNALKNKRISVGKREICLSDLILWCFSILLFAALIPYMFWLNALSEQHGLSGELFSPSGYVLLGVLDWLTVLTAAVAIVMPFFKKQAARDYCAFFAIPVVLLNIIFLNSAVKANLGVEDMNHWRTWIHAGRILLMAMICGSTCIKTIVDGDFDNIGKRLAKMAGFFFAFMMAFMPTYFPQLLFGPIGEVTEDFTFLHRVFIYIGFVLPLVIYFTQRKQSDEDKHFLLVMLALSGFIQYFIYHPHRTGAAMFPLHLCNTAMVLMLIAYAFKIKSLYYFTYFINVLGAFCAIILPNLSHVALSVTSMTYWYNHWYAFFLPLLGVALGVFERPSLKLMSSSLIVFTIYVGFVFFLNSYLNSPKFEGKYNADYFFLYSDFFIDKFAFAKDLKYNYIWTYQAFGTELTAYPVFVLTIYLAFIALTFAIWGFYTTIFNISDAHRQLAYRKKLQRLDHLNLLKELDGRPLNTPLHPEGANMVKISHFSKTYAGSDKKSVDDLSLEIHDGEVFGFIGHNGAGKSTTIKSLVGIQSITEGSIEVEGYDIARQPLEAKLNMGYVSDNHALYEKLTGREYINYVADLYMVSEEDKKERIEKYVKMFKLEHAIDREIKSYSHGMKQKCMVISALIHNPKVWVLDEPLTGLDPTSSWQIKECMRQHADAGNIVFFSSHVIEVVEKICDRIAIISGGKLRRISTIEEIKAEGISLEQLYLQYAQQHDAEAGANADAVSEEETDENGAA